MKLVDAIVNGDTKKLDELIARGCNIKEQDPSTGDTAMHYAVKARKIQIIDHLLQKKYLDINVRNNLGETPLLFAARQMDLEMFQYLLGLGATISDQNKSGQTALMYAIKNGDAKLFDYILINGQTNFTEKDNNGSTALLYAVRYHKCNMIESLLDLTSLSLQDTENDGNNALHLAKGCFSTVDTLLNKGAFIDMQLKDGRTIMNEEERQYHTKSGKHFDKSLYSLSFAAWLLSTAQQKQVDSKGYRDYGVIYHSNPRTIENGNSTLHFAILNKHLCLIRELLKQNVDVFIQNNDNITPLMLLQDTYSHDPEILILGHIASCNQALSKLGRLKEWLNKIQSFQKNSFRHVSEELKSKQEIQQIETKESKEIQEKNNIENARCKALEQQIAILTKQIVESASQLEQLAAKESIPNDQLMKISQMLIDPMSTLFNPDLAYRLLSLISKYSSTFYEQAHFLCAKLLISGQIEFQTNSHNSKRVIVKVLDKKPISQDKATREYHVESIVKHLLYCKNKWETHELLSTFISVYLFDDNQGFSNLSQACLDKPESQLALFTAIKEKIHVLKEKETKREQELLENRQKFINLEERFKAEEATVKSQEAEIKKLRELLAEKNKLLSTIPTTKLDNQESQTVLVASNRDHTLLAISTENTVIDPILTQYSTRSSLGI